MLTCLLLALAHAQNALGLLVPVSFGLFCVAHFRLLRLPLKLDLTTWAIAALIFWLTVSTVFNGMLNGIAINDYVSHYCQWYYLGGFYLVMRFIKYDKNIEINIYRSSIATGFLLSVISLFSLYIYPIQIMGVNFSGRGYVYGPLGNHDPMAAMTGVALVLTWVVFMGWRENAYQRIMPKWMLYLSLVVLTVTFTVARSRGYSLGLIFALFFPMAWRGVAGISRKNMGRQVLFGSLTAFVIFVGIGLALSDRVASIFESGPAGSSAISDDPNVQTRFLLWGRALVLFSQSVLTGIGPGAFEQTGLRFEPVIPMLISRRVQGYYLDQKINYDPEGGLHTHDVFLQILTEFGVIGFVLVFTAFLSAILAVRKSRKRDNQRIPDDGRRNFHYSLSIALFLYLGGSGITGGYTFMSPYTMWLFLFVLARIRVGLAHDKRILVSSSHDGGRV